MADSSTPSHANGPKPNISSEGAGRPAQSMATSALDEQIEKLGGTGPQRRRRSSSILVGLDTTTSDGRAHHGPRSSTSDRRASVSKRQSEDSKPHSRSGHESDEISASVELDDLSEDDSQDDEEAGLTGQDGRRQKKASRRDSSLGNRIAGVEAVSAEDKKVADVHVLKNMMINCSLIGLWYCFSLSISLVTFSSPLFQASKLIQSSITNGCSRRNISTFTSPSSRHADTCLCSLRFHPSCCSFSHSFDLDMILSQIHTTISQRMKISPSTRRTARNL